MADNSVFIDKMARLLALAHILIGSLLFIFGVAERAMQYFWTGDICFGIWIGIWMCITGGLGVHGTSRDKTATQGAFAFVFMGFSITSAVLGGIIVTFYSMAFGGKLGYSGAKGYDARMAICAVILTLGIAEFIIGIWAAVCCCLMKPCTCYEVTTPPEEQLEVHPSNHSCSNYEFSSAGYVIVQGPDGVPKLVPVQPGSSVIAVQASVAYGGQPPMILVPTSAAVGGLPQPGFVPMAVPVQADGCTFIVQPSISEPK